MPVKVRPNPVIPDHEVLRKIGGGAYGEVWLARGVTGALRAVKVVWREDFEDERSFEREFEGILKFEPISRDHPALVNILHVGRSPDAAFYYYVMQLGDDIRTGRDINPIEYEPRTLRADHHQAAGVRWDTDECIDVGLRLAEALHHLHESGLAHRDVKPSNVIFVNGKAKLADIGLVAARGQRTFVGTEGFVPPEGPGSARADVYSLGKVLYEIATGKDRMNFPELPDDMPVGADRKRWLELNRIICEICEPRVSKRKISTAADLAESLRRIQRGKRRRRGGLAVSLTTMMLAAFAAWCGWLSVKDMQWVKTRLDFHKEPERAVGMMRVFSTPEGADVFDSKGTLVGTTPTSTMTAKVGEMVSFTLRKNGYRTAEVSGRMTLAAVKGETMTLYQQLQVFSPPQPGEPWTDHLSSPYQPVDGHHLGSGFVTQELWKKCDRIARLPQNEVEVLKFSQNGQPVDIVLAKDAAAAVFCGWLRTNGIKAGFLTEDHEVTARRDSSFEHPGMSDNARNNGLRPFRVMVRRIVYGEIQLASQPPGAEVYLNGVAVGTSQGSMNIPNVKPGAIDLLLVLEGYKPIARKLVLKEGQTLDVNITLEKNQGVVFGRPWENGIHMQFVPVGQDLMVSIWETRVSDYGLFVRETKRAPAPPAFFTQEADHPVVHVSRDDARAFCEWLTVRERKAERISSQHVYRLPSDLEWSLMAGIQEEVGISPNLRDSRKAQVFPWGFAWPEEVKVGNFADISAAGAPGVSADRIIPGYDDGYEYTAPVGSFPPNDSGIHDLSGNVQEWVEDDFSKQENILLGVLRGGGWNTYQIENLYTGSRNAVSPTYRDSNYGFRVVLAKVPPKEE
jgi:eukaryotic-like serine/threonine-protein kinase